MRFWLFVLMVVLCVLVPVYALRVVTLGPRLTEQVFELGRGTNIVGNTIFCTRPDAAQRITRVGNVIEINVEAIAALRPDLILGTDLNDPKRLEALRQLGLRVVVFNQPANFDEICAEYMEIARLLGREGEAERRISTLKREVEQIRRQTARAAQRRVFFQIGINPLWTLPDKSFMQDYLRHAHAVNIATNVGWGQIGLEQVVAADPEVILVALMDNEANEALSLWRRYTNMRAVRQGRIHVIDTTMATSPTPSTFVTILRQIVSLTR